MTSSHTLSRRPARATASHPLPSPDERRRLRELWDLTPQQVAVAFGVRVATVRSWESGRSQPAGKRREAYRRFLQGLAQRADAQPRAAALPASRSPESGAHRGLARREANTPAAVLGPPAPAAPGDVEEPSVHGARLGAAIAVLAGWVLVLVALGTYLPGWAG